MVKKEIIISGLKINYLVSPGFNQDQAVVFLPGWKSPVNLFCSVMGDIPNLLAVNLPGWGGSDRPSGNWGLVEYSGFIREFLQKLGIDKPILIGHSIGGAIAVDYLAAGGQAKKLIIISGAIIRERSGQTRIMFVGAKIFRFLFPFINKCFRQRLAGKVLSPDYVQAGELEGTYKRLISEDRKNLFTKLSLPIILIWGRNDQDTPYAQAEQLKVLQSQAILEAVPNAGHYCFLDRPNKFREIIFKFL
ncbi:MAG: alpha/beta hydrolase [Candidatus Falkowbacteria bacterium]|nr:alpha/beta hydrolase [Candidatus Falkowbacteria bacterium]